MTHHAEDLTDAQQTELHQALVRLREELTAALQSTSEESRPVDLDTPIGRISRMDAMQQQQMAKAQRRRIEVRLQQVHAAFTRWEDGAYGECHACSDPIGYGRLHARPEAPLCASCQQAAEARR